MAGLFDELLSEINRVSEQEGVNFSYGSVLAKNFKPKKLELKKRYLQIALNGDIDTARRVALSLPQNERIFLECGTPFIKRYGEKGIREISSLWGGFVVADIKTVDGALDEVVMCKNAGANAATVIGGAPKETIDIFIENCRKLDMVSMIDMIGVNDPLKAVTQLKRPPDVAILHVGRDEETTRGKQIQYRHVTRLKSKFDIFISAAGGVGIKESRSAIFNGAGIVVVNIVDSSQAWRGISVSDDIATLANQFLATIE